MEYLIFLFFLLTCAVGFTAVTISFIFYFKYRKKTLFYYAFFLGSLIIMHFSFTIDLFNSLATLNDPFAVRILERIDLWCQSIGFNLCIMMLPWCFHTILGVPATRARKAVLGVLLFLAVFDAGLFLFAGTRLFGIGVFEIILFTVTIYILALIKINFNTIGNKEFKQAIKLFAIVTIVFFPFLVLDAFPGLIPFSPIAQPYKTLTLPSYFFIINIVGIYIAMKHFNQPAFYKKGHLTPHFVKSFNISNREQEIIQNLTMGLSNKEIGEKLFISYRTVENHLYKIYQKTNVRNRVELSNLIKTN